MLRPTLLTLTLLPALHACSIPYSSIGISPRRYVDWANSAAPEVTLFGAGDVPTVVVTVPEWVKDPSGEELFGQGFFGRKSEVGTVSILNAANGALAKSESREMRNSRLYRFTFDLATGHYVAVLTIRGREIVRSRAFNVQALPAPPVVTAPVQQQQQQQQQQQTILVPGGQGERGTVFVSSNVENAEIFVDGLFTGNAPAALKLVEGIHIIEVRSARFQTYRRELRVIGGSELSVRATLVR